MISRYVLQKWAKKPKKFISYLNNYCPAHKIFGSVIFPLPFTRIFCKCTL